MQQQPAGNPVRREPLECCNIRSTDFSIDLRAEEGDLNAGPSRFFATRLYRYRATACQPQVRWTHAPAMHGPR